MRHCLTVLFVAGSCAVAHADLFEYVNRPDDSFTWQLGEVEDARGGKVFNIHMTSQVWQDIKWEHELQIYEPATVEFPDVMGLLITGGKPGDDDRMLGLTVANMIGIRFATLYDIPNQPLFEGLEEDALIAYTWQKYLETGDENWPLQFPMVKASVRAMDALAAVAQEQWQVKLRGFMIMGASKRGWTTYLAAIADPDRAVAIAPMVFDVLNLPVSAPHQKDFWGDYSLQIADYTKAGLIGQFETERGFRLAWMVDPYTYRDRLHMPKLVILGSNDPYWPTDAVNFYWNGLPTPRWLLICPNSGHDLGDRLRLLSSITTFCRALASGQSIPRVAWDYTETPAGATLTMGVEANVKEARVWVAHSPVCDFRPAKWEEQAPAAQGDQWVAEVARTQGQWTACYGELVIELDGRPLYVSTQPRVMHPVTAQ